MPSIDIVGAGVVGTATGMGFLQHGHDVTFIDSSDDRVATLRRRGLRSRHVNAVEHGDMADFTFVAVSAPTGREGVDLTNLRDAATRLGRHVAQAATKNPGHWPTIVFRCTMPPGSMRQTLIPILEDWSGLRAGVDFGVAYNPEYLRAVSAEADFLSPRLITIATLERDDRSHERVTEVLSGFGAEMCWLSLETAEFHKYVNNVGNAVKISTYNYFRSMGYELGLTDADIDRAFEASVHSAEGLWNPSYGTRNFGPYGGACLPKDTKGLLIMARRLGIDTGLLDTVEAINDANVPEAELAG